MKPRPGQGPKQDLINYSGQADRDRTRLDGAVRIRVRPAPSANTWGGESADLLRPISVHTGKTSRRTQHDGVTESWVPPAAEAAPPAWDRLRLVARVAPHTNSAESSERNNFPHHKQGHFWAARIFVESASPTKPPRAWAHSRQAHWRTAAPSRGLWCWCACHSGLQNARQRA